MRTASFVFLAKHFGIIIILFSTDLFLEILDEFIGFFVVVSVLMLLCLYKAISFFRRKGMRVAEVDENAIYYLNRYNNIKYVYFVEIEDVYLRMYKKINVLRKNGRNETITIDISEEDKREFISLVPKNLKKKKPEII